MEEIIKELKNLLLRDNPILFTGSGFSKFALTKNGDSLPDGYQLKKEILEKLLKIQEKSPEFEELIKSSLSDLCQYCIHERTDKHLEDFLVEIYADCKPKPFHVIFSKYQWKKIYTTNIDDIIENSFPPNKINVQNLNRPKLINTSGKIEYIKLHGCVRNPSGKFVFSANDYIDSMLKSQDYRFNQFGQDIQFGDFIFVGTDYSEVNLDYYLKLYETSGGISSKGRLFFINPKPSIIFKTKIKGIGGKIIEWTTEQFANFIETEILQASSAKLPANKKVFLDGFYNYNLNQKKYSGFKNYRSNLFLGFEPKWLDIFYDWDFINLKVSDDFSTFRQYLQKYKINQSTFCLVGKTMTGKSVYLKRLGHELFKEGFEVLEFFGRRFDSFSLVKYARDSDNDKFCLIIDNGSYYYGALKSLMKNFPRDKELLILTASRPFFHSRKKYNLITEDFYEHHIDPSIDDQLSVEIERKLDVKGYLGQLKKYSKESRVEKIKFGNDISNVLFKITYGQGFYKRFQDNLEKSFSHLEIGKDILIGLTVFQILDLSYYPIELLNLIYPGQIKSALNNVEDFVKFNEYNGIELRNLFLAKTIRRKLTNHEIIGIVKNILVTISPQVTEDSHSYWNEIQATLMKEKLLRKRLELKTREIKNLLFEIQPFYNDNYNYWLQVGIAEQIDEEFDKALNHFRQAESLSPNSYMVQNAVARNFLKQANSISDKEMALPYFEEGENLILALINNREEFQVKAFSTHCYLYEKVNFLRKNQILPSNNELKKLFDMLSVIIEKTPEDDMSRHISNHFYTYLKEIKKTNIINVKFYDLSKLKALFEQYSIDIISVFEDFEIDE